MIRNGSRMSGVDLEGMLERVEELSDAQLAELRTKLDGDQDERPVDLHAYRERNREQRSRERKRTYSLLERVKHSLGFTPERAFDRELSTARSLYSTYSRMVSDLQSTLSEGAQKVQELESEKVRSRAHLETVSEQYQRKQSKVDRLEAEVEELAERNGQRLHAGSYELRRELSDARGTLVELRSDMHRSVRTYQRARYEHAAYESQQRALDERLSEFQKQETALRIRLDRWETDRTVMIGGREPSMRELYEDIGITIQRIQDTLEQDFDLRDGGLDTAYGASMDAPEDDALTRRCLSLLDA